MKLKYLPHYTYEDYQKWQGDWELLEGIPYAMASPKLTNQIVLTKLVFILNTAINEKDCPCIPVVEVDWVISENTVVRPDLSVICEGFDQDYIRRPPILVAEIVSESTKRMDEEIKFELYREEGVKYYLLLYPENRSWKLYENVSKRFLQKHGAELELKNCKINLDIERVWR
ncbi:MAG: Uma2 family endonuclease [Aquificaceae bacterium]|nr:Uma2 family endonuclease [Aquificaceae bacterium]